MIELRQLRFIVAAVDYGSLHRAASELSVEQSTLSRSIAKLERVVGTTLLNRSHAGVTATAAGAEFIGSIRPIITMTDGLLTRLRSTQRGNIAGLTLGHDCSLSAGKLRDALNDWRTFAPESGIEAVEAGPTVLRASLHSGVVDIAIVPGETSYPEMSCMQIWREHLLAALPINHALTKQDPLSWPQLCQHPIMLTVSSSEYLGHAIRQTSNNNGYVHPTVKLVNTSRESLLSMLGLGNGISILCESGTGVLYPGVVYREVRGLSNQPEIPYSAYWRTGNDNPALKCFVAFLRSRQAGATFRF